MVDIFEKLLGRSDVASIALLGKDCVPLGNEVTIHFVDGDRTQVSKKELFDSFWVSQHEWGRSCSWLLSLSVATGVPCNFWRDDIRTPYLMVTANPDGSYEDKLAGFIGILTPSQSRQKFHLTSQEWHDSDPRNKLRPNWWRRILRSL